MPLRYHCPSCQKEMIVRAQRVGDLALCQNCGATNPVPDSAQSIDTETLDYLHQQVPPSPAANSGPTHSGRPLNSEDFGSILRESFSIPFTKVPILFLLAAIYEIPVGIFTYLMDSNMTRALDPNNPFPMMAQYFRTLGYFIAIVTILSCITMPATYLAIVDHLLGRKVRFWTVVSESMARVPWMLVSVIFVSLMVVAMMVTIIGMPFAIYFSVAWAFVGMCVVIQQLNPIQALSASYALVKGNWWRVVGVLLVAILAAVGVALIPMIIAALLPEPSKTILKIAYSLVIHTVPVTAGLLTYLRLKIEKQNFTLAQLAELRQRLTVTE
jgi:hypothetical protein